MGWGRGGCRCAVVRIVAVRWVRSVLGVDKPLVVAVCGLSQRVVRAEDVVVEPVWSWNHVVMDVGGCCRNGPICEIRVLFYRRGHDSVRTGGDRWWGLDWQCLVS